MFYAHHYMLPQTICVTLSMYPHIMAGCVIHMLIYGGFVLPEIRMSLYVVSVVVLQIYSAYIISYKICPYISWTIWDTKDNAHWDKFAESMIFNSTLDYLIKVRGRLLFWGFFLSWLLNKEYFYVIPKKSYV